MRSSLLNQLILSLNIAMSVPHLRSTCNVLRDMHLPRFNWRQMRRDLPSLGTCVLTGRSASYASQRADCVLYALRQRRVIVTAQPQWGAKCDADPSGPDER